MSDNEALMPNTEFLKFIREVKQTDKGKSTLTKRENAFAIMSDMDGWSEFVDMVRKDLENLRSLVDYELAGASLNELGLRFLVADLTADRIESYLNKVIRAKQVFDEESLKNDNSIAKDSKKTTSRRVRVNKKTS